MLENPCRQCDRICPGRGERCDTWKEYFVKNWNQNIHRKKIEHIIVDQSERCAWQYEHPDLVREGFYGQENVGGHYMKTREQLSDLIMHTPACAFSSRTAAEHIADNLIANGVNIAPIVPGPSEGNHNMAELCFHNGEEHFREKVINKLMDMQTNVRGVQYSLLVALVEIVRGL